jgi:SAM-dependent methyltransferase
MFPFTRFFRKASGDSGPRLTSASYRELYESHARHCEGEQAVGIGPYDQIGRRELDLLKVEGLQPNQSLVDFGCGSGRLAQFAIPYLKGGHYIGIDISKTFLQQARDRISRLIPDPPCQVSWVEQPPITRFPIKDYSADMICAFSVFTHMEHEDTFRYLVDALRILRPGARFVFSCLPIDLAAAQDIFATEAAMDLGQRWRRPRNVVTSTDFVQEICHLAGWKVIRWYKGDEKSVRDEQGIMHAFGQSVCVLQSASGSA